MKSFCAQGKFKWYTDKNVCLFWKQLDNNYDNLAIWAPWTPEHAEFHLQDTKTLVDLSYITVC